MPKRKRIKTDKFKTRSFWLIERDGKYIPYRSFAHVLTKTPSPSIAMSAGQGALKQAYKAGKLLKEGESDAVELQGTGPGARGRA